MIKNYLKIAFRNLMKYKFISFINLFGLTVGLTCCLLISTYIINELSYDKYNNKAENIYRFTRIFRNSETGVVSLHLGTLAPPFGPLLKNDFPQIQKMTVLLPSGTTTLQYGDKIFNERNSYFADENFFGVFKLNMLKGNSATALKEPYSVMLNEEMARKYFGNEEPLNKMVKFDNTQRPFRVTGVYESFPANSHIHPSIMFSFNTLRDTAIYGEENLRTNWGNNSFLTYAVLPDNVDVQKMEAQFPAFLDKVMTQPGDKVKPSKWTALTLQKLTDIHLKSHLDYEAEENGDIKRVYIFSAIALFILLIACINYMNLSTARSALRAREIGIRKVVGAERKEIIAQFLSESVIISFIAMLLALALTYFALPWLNKVSGQTLSFAVLFKGFILLCLLLVPVVVGFVSGIYPAVFMSSFQPVKVLKGMMKIGGSTVSFRKVLVTVQFAVSIILIISTGVVFQQLKYMQQTSLGLDKDHVLTISYNTRLDNAYESFRTSLLADARVTNVTRSSRIPSGRLLDAQGSEMSRGDSLAPTNADIKYVAVDQDFIKTYNIKMVEGRSFSRSYGTDSSSFILNEAAVKALGLKSASEAVGKDFRYADVRGKVVGIMKDFHFESMRQAIVPLILIVPAGNGNYGSISVKISGGNIAGAINHIEKVWKQFLPEAPFDYSFVDERYDRLYESEQRQGTIFTVFAGIAIFIACLGLFGLSSFTITQRIKEIGIRKVLGASVGSIVQLLSKDFLKLVAIAAVIAFPVAWYAMHQWLLDFAYRISIPWWMFVVAGIIAALIALVTISLLTVKAAMANPVKSLRTE
ncbi:ABC transporter permease [Foetidibacter luteolus]|uniref:ABC transporter permease n=1 Tax=Foetidibacter luteolus TaxID=2608880 RepID=UPI00129A5CF3|nr:ABC transporter permease [Foetidibacter luteolus]